MGWLGCGEKERARDKGGWGAYLIEHDPPQLGQPSIIAPKPRRGRIRRLGEEQCGKCTDNEDAEPQSSTRGRPNTLPNRNSQNVSKEIAAVEDEVAVLPDLAADVLVAVDGGSRRDLPPNDKEETEVVDIGIDGVEEVVAEFGAEHKGDKKRDDGHDGDNDGTRELLAPIGVADHGDDCLEQCKGGGHAEQEQGEEEADGPEVCSGHGGKGFRVGEEADGERAECHLGWFEVEEPHDAEDGECNKNFVHAVGDGDDEGVLNGVGVFLIVGGERGEVAHADADAEEDLAAGGLPDIATAELFTVPFPVEFDAAAGVGKGGPTTDQDESHDDGKSHSEVDDAASETNTSEYAEPDDEPSEEAPRYSLWDHAAFRIGDHAAVWYDSLAVGNDGAHEVFLSSTCPWHRAGERIAEEGHDPSEDGNVVGDDYVSEEVVNFCDG